jgi:phage shock protein C
MKMSKGKLYRSPNGKIMGVCQGLSNWLRVDVGLVRLGFIISAFITGGVVFFVYLALGIFLPIEDELESDSIFDKVRSDFSDGTGSSRYRKGRRITVEDVKNEFDNLKSRVSKMEDSVFNKERDWDERFKKSES